MYLTYSLLGEFTKASETRLSKTVVCVADDVLPTSSLVFTMKQKHSQPVRYVVSLQTDHIVIGRQFRINNVGGLMQTFFVGGSY